MDDRTSIDDWELLSQMSHLFRGASEAFLNKIGIPRGQATLLCVIAKQQGMSQSEIADALSVQGATVSNMLQRLEEAGYVTRYRDAEDNRLVRVNITDDGLKIEASINEQFAELQALFFKGISEEEQELLRKNLQQIIENLSS